MEDEVGSYVLLGSNGQVLVARTAAQWLWDLVGDVPSSHYWVVNFLEQSHGFDGVLALWLV